MKLDEMKMRQIYTVGDKEVEELLESDFSEARDLFLKTNKALYRGTQGSTKRIVDPKARGPRPNANMFSAVNAFIDTDPSWRGFPRRGQSIIMTSEASDAEDYGDVAVVFPINGSRVGCAHKRDFWFVAENNKRQHHLYSLSMLEEVVELIVTAIDTFNPSLSDQLHNAFFKHGSGAYKQAIKANQILDKVLVDDDTESHLLDWVENGPGSTYGENTRKAAAKIIRMGWINYLSSVLSPHNAGLTVERIDDMTSIKGMTEYWTDGKCLLLDQRIWMDLKKDVFKK